MSQSVTRREGADALRTFFGVLLASPLIRPNSLAAINPQLDNVYDILTIIAVGILILCMLQKRIRNVGLLMASLVFFAEIYVVTYLHNNAYNAVLRVATVSIGMVLWVYVFGDDCITAIKSPLLVLELLIYANAISIILKPEGMYWTRVNSFSGSHNCWVMGYDNHWFFYYYTAFGLEMLNMRYSRQRFRCLFMLAVLNITSFYTRSGVLVVGILMLDMIYLTRVYDLPGFGLQNLLFISIAVSVIYVFASTNDWMQSFLVSIGKTASVSARVRIWSAALKVISENPIFGIGRIYSNYGYFLYGLVSAVNAHNNWIEVLVEGGVIGGFLYLMIFALVSRKLVGHDSTLVRIALVPLFCMMVAMSVDAVIEIRGVCFWYLMAILYLVDLRDDGEIRRSESEDTWGRQVIQSAWATERQRSNEMTRHLSR